MLAVALAAGWLWASWLRGWFPFSPPAAVTPEKIMQQTSGSVLNSLTAPERSPQPIPKSVLDSLTAKK